MLCCFMNSSISISVMKYILIILGFVVATGLLCALQHYVIAVWILSAVIGVSLASIWPTVASYPSTLDLVC